MREESDAVPRGHPLFARREILTGEQNLPAAWTQEGGQDPEKRGLAGTIRSEKCQDLAAAQREGDVTEGHAGSEASPEAPRLHAEGGNQTGVFPAGLSRDRDLRLDSRLFSSASTCPTTSAASPWYRVFSSR